MPQITLTFGEGAWRLLRDAANAEGREIREYVVEAALSAAASSISSGRESATADERKVARGAPDAPASGDEAAAGDATLRAIRDGGRLRALERTGLLDSEPEQALDEVAALAADALEAPTAAVSLVDVDRQYFKASVGLPEPWASKRETPLAHSFCKYAVASGEPLLVEDARQHAELRASPAIQDLNVISYIGIPLFDPDGYALGTLCVMDSRPRDWTQGHVQILRDLASIVTRAIAQRGTSAGGTQPIEDSR